MHTRFWLVYYQCDHTRDTHTEGTRPQFIGLPYSPHRQTDTTDANYDSGSEMTTDVWLVWALLPLLVENSRSSIRRLCWHREPGLVSLKPSLTEPGRPQCFSEAWRYLRGRCVCLTELTKRRNCRNACAWDRSPLGTIWRTAQDNSCSLISSFTCLISLSALQLNNFCKTRVVFREDWDRAEVHRHSL